MTTSRVELPRAFMAWIAFMVAVVYGAAPKTERSPSLGAVGDKGFGGISLKKSIASCRPRERSGRLKLLAVALSVLVVIVLIVASGASMFGGSSITPHAGQVASTPGSPPALCTHAMVYDSQSDRIVLFGGLDRSVGWCDETWTYDFDTNTWENMIPTLAPPPRGYHEMAYDSHSDKVVLWGGCWEVGGYMYAMDDTWTYDFETNSWTDMNPSVAPPGRFWFGLAYDSESDRVVKFGGHEQWNLYEDTWAYDLGTNEWSEMNPANPPYVDDSVFVYNSKSDRMVLFGNVMDESEGIWRSMTWTYDLERDRWTNMEPSQEPPNVWCHAMAYDSQSDRVIMFGGSLGSSDTDPIDQTWAYDLQGNTWTRMYPATRPSARAWHAMAYDSQSDRVILFGGSTTSTYSNETWSYDYESNTWTLMPPGPVIPEFSGILLPIVCLVLVVAVAARWTQRKTPQARE